MKWGFDEVGQARIQKIVNLGAQQYKLSGWTGGGGANLFFGLTYKSEQGGVRRVRPPLNPRLLVCVRVGGSFGGYLA